MSKKGWLVLHLSEEELQGLAGESVEQLTARVKLGSVLIQTLVGDEDPRALRAMESLRVQQEQINEIIAKKTEGTRPEPVRIGMQPATFKAKIITPASKG